MADKTAISWTDATWNPVTGCQPISAGCDHCYAQTFAERWRNTPGHYFANGFDVTLRPDKLALPLHWKRPRRVFVNSMSDLFHRDVPDAYIGDVFAVMTLATQHTFQLLTKRHARMRTLLNAPEFQGYVAGAASRIASELQPGLWGVGYAGLWPLPNVWLGVSVEDQQWANIRVPALQVTPAAVRWISCEPLLGPVDLSQHLPRRFEREQGGYWIHTADTDIYGNGRRWMSGPSISWVVVGGESGPGARPMDDYWAGDIVHQCRCTDTPVYVKQLGAVWARKAGIARTDRAGADMTRWPGELRVRQYPTTVEAAR